MGHMASGSVTVAILLSLSDLGGFKKPTDRQNISETVGNRAVWD